MSEPVTAPLTASPVSVADAAVPGWTFGDSAATPWQTLSGDVRLKMLGAADGKVIAIFQFDAGYVGGTHHHFEPEFSYVLEGSVVSQGVLMTAGCTYAAQAGTDHLEFRSPEGCTLVSVFKAPS